MACPNQVSGVSVQAGAAGVHVTVVDQNCNPVAPANLSFTLPASLTGVLTIEVDATGFNLSVANINQAATSGNVVFMNTPNGVHSSLGVAVTPGGVTTLAFTDP